MSTGSDLVDGVLRLSRVAPGVWRSGRYTAAGLMRLVAHTDIRRVIDLRAEDRPPMLAASTYRRIGVELVRLPMPEGGPVDVDAVLRCMRSRFVLVHCWRGLDRTGIAVALYRVHVEGWAAADALVEMASVGPARKWALDAARRVAESVP